MPTIAFVSPKGGSGKTTSAFLLSTALAKLYDVTVIDADPNHPIQTWANGGNTPLRLTMFLTSTKTPSLNASKTPRQRHLLSSSIWKARHQRSSSMQSCRRISSSFRRKARNWMQMRQARRFNSWFRVKS